VFLVGCTTDPFDNDTDDDNLCDGVEDTNQNGRIDGDNGDGIYDNTEIWEETNPNHCDTDGDCFIDSLEYQFGYNPLCPDSDGDGLNDNKEDKNYNGNLDIDETSPCHDDTDNDGLNDYEEESGWYVVLYEENTGKIINKYSVTSNSRKKDTDDDGLIDSFESIIKTDPNKNDTDGDGITDFLEIYPDDGIVSSPISYDLMSPTISFTYNKFEITKNKLGMVTKFKIKSYFEAFDPSGLNIISLRISGFSESKKYFTGERVNNSYFSNTFQFSRVFDSLKSNKIKIFLYLQDNLGNSQNIKIEENIFNIGMLKDPFKVLEIYKTTLNRIGYSILNSIITCSLHYFKTSVQEFIDITLDSVINIYKIQDISILSIVKAISKMALDFFIFQIYTTILTMQILFLSVEPVRELQF